MPLGEFEQILLLALLQRGGQADGVAIRREIERRTGRDVSAGAVYTAMDRLQRRGLVSSTLGEPTPQRGGKRRRLYEIESAGQEAVDRTVTTLDRMSEGLTLGGIS